MLHTIKRIFARRAATLPVIGILAIAATACQGVGLTEARQAVDNQRAINEIEDRELRPIERDLESLYENQILPRERELEDLWNQMQDLENGAVKDAFSNTRDPWAPGGAATLLQQEFNEKYAEIDRLYRELDVESRRIQIEQQFDTGSFNGVNPAVTALEDERFGLQRELDRLHQFGRRPIEDIYLQMNELNASNGWSQSDIYVADDLNRQIADIQNQIANAHANGAQFNDQNQQELISLDKELNFLRTEGFAPIQEIYNRISELELQVAVNADGTVAGSTTTAADADTTAKIEQLKADMAGATAPLRIQLDELNAKLQVIKDDAQAQVNDLLAQATTPEPVDTSALQAEVDSLLQQSADAQAAIEAVVAGLDVQILGLNTQIADLHQLTDTEVAGLQSQITDLHAQIDALDTTTEDYETTKADLEGQVDVLQGSIDSAIANETTAIADLQSQVDALNAQKVIDQGASDTAIADLQSQIDAKQGEIDAANSSSASSTSVSQEVLDQIAAIELARDESTVATKAEIDSLHAQIEEIERPYKDQIADLELATTVTDGTTATGVVVTDTTALQSEIQALRDHAALQEQTLNEKIRVLEERRNKLQSSINDSAASGTDIAALEAKLVLLHDELNALQNSGIDASRNYNLTMEELQNKAVQLEKDLSIEIRAIEDRLWEFDGRIAELYRSNDGSGFDPYAKYNERLKQIELERFELEQRRWAIDDEQQAAFNQFNNVGSEQFAEAEARREELVGPLQERIDVLENELRDLRLTQRDLEDNLRDAQRLVDEQIRELENQTLDLIDDAVTAAEEGAETLNSLENGQNGTLEGLDLSLLEGTDPTIFETVDPTGVVIEATASAPAN